MKVGEVINLALSASKVNKFELVDSYKNYFTFRVHFLDETKVLTDKEVEVLRKKLVEKLNKEFGVRFRG